MFALALLERDGALMLLAWLATATAVAVSACCRERWWKARCTGSARSVGA